MKWTRFHSILQNLHYSNNNNDNKTDKSSKIRPVIEHLNEVFAESLSNSPFESVDEQMFKLIRQVDYETICKEQPIKCGFNYWYSCDSEIGYVCQLEFYQQQKEKRELNLGSRMVLDVCQVLKDTYCHVFFDNFFKSLTLIQKWPRYSSFW